MDVASAFFTRRPVRREIHLASLVEARGRNKLESVPQGMVATRSQSIK